MISWRNPTRKQADWNLDTYAERVRRAIGVARAITGSPDVNTMGFCAGGIITTTLLNHLAATGDDRVHSASFAVTLLDFESAGADRRLLRRAPARAGAAARRRRSGCSPRKGLGSVFSWMRPDDLVFNYLVNQWLMGEAPPAFDVLAWNADGTNLPAALHEQFLEIFRDNSLVRPGALTVLGTPVDLAKITVPTFVTGAATDHLTPWTGCYRTTQLLSGPSTFVLSYSGHIQSLVNPPGNPKAHTGPAGSRDRTPGLEGVGRAAPRQLVGALVAVDDRAVGRPWPRRSGWAAPCTSRWRRPGLVRGRPGARGSGRVGDADRCADSDEGVCLGGHEPALVGGDDGLGAVPGTELQQHAADVRLHRLPAQEELAGDLGVGQPAGDEPQDVGLAAGQSGQRARTPGPGRRVRGDEAAGDVRQHQRGPPCDDPDRVDQFVGVGPLQREPARPGLQRPVQVVVVLERGQH